MEYDLLNFDQESMASGISRQPIHSTGIPVENLLEEGFPRRDTESIGVTGLEEQVRLLMEETRRQRERTRLMEEKIQSLSIENTMLRERETEDRGRSRFLASGRRIPTMQEHLEHQELNQSRLMATNVSQQHQRCLLKPKDVPLLKIESLSKVTSKQLLHRFLRSVEACADTDEGRIDVAKNRLCEGTWPVVMRELKGREVSWSEFEAILYQLFTVKIEVGTFIQALNSTRYSYSLEEDPRAFVNKLRVLYSSVEGSGLPDQDTVIKQKLLEGLDPSMKAAMNILMVDTNTKLSTFVEELEKLRNAQSVKSQSERRIRELEETSPTNSEERGESGAIQTSDALVSLTNAITEQIRQGQADLVRALSKEKQTTKFCGYCRSKDQHWSSNCPQNPPRGSCFDCWTVGHKRNDAVCPKKRE